MIEMRFQTHKTLTKMAAQKFNYSWRGISVDIEYDLNYNSTYLQEYDIPLALIIVTAPERLPISETGYKRVIIPLDLEDYTCGVPALVTAWLEEYAQHESWLEYAASKSQLSLF